MTNWRDALWRDAVVVERFWRYALPTDGCWLWTSALNVRGYARLVVRHDGVRKRIRAYCLSWQIANAADWPEGAIARHTCDNPACVNPSHIIPGTQSENNKDAVARGRHKNASKTHCKQGHPLFGSNLVIHGPRSQRGCRTCRNAASLRHWYRTQERSEAA